MNWLMKISVQYESFKWISHFHKALELLIPGEWKDFYQGANSDVTRCSFMGENIMIKPNALFWVRVRMHRPRIIPMMDSDIGNKEIYFECYVQASSIKQWPTFGKVIGHNDMLDTPYEIAKFVQNSIENHRTDNDDGDEEPVEPTPIAPPSNVPVPVMSHKIAQQDIVFVGPEPDDGRYTTTNETMVITALFNQKVIAYMTLYPRSDMWSVGMVNVDSKYRRQGISNKLHDIAYQFASSQGKHLGSGQITSPENLAYWENQPNVEQVDSNHFTRRANWLQKIKTANSQVLIDSSKYEAELMEQLNSLSDFSMNDPEDAEKFTPEIAEKTKNGILQKTLVNMQRIVQMIQGVISSGSWSGSSVTLSPVMSYDWYNKPDYLNPTDSSEISVGVNNEWGGSLSFSLFFDEKGQAIVDDVLEAGDEDFFGAGNAGEGQDYFLLVRGLKNPGFAESTKALTLYTARPVKDRAVYMDATSIPANIFLTTSYDFAQSFGLDYSEQRDVWRVRIEDRYLFMTEELGTHRNYQTIGQDLVPVKSIRLVDMGE